MKKKFTLMIVTLLWFAISAQNNELNRVLSTSNKNVNNEEVTQITNRNSSNNENIKLYIQNTDFSIAASKKHLLALKKADVNIDLENAMILRAYSLKLYESGSINKALICSSKARQIAVTLLTNLKGADYSKSYDKFENEEILLVEIKKDTSTVDIWLKEAKQ